MDYTRMSAYGYVITDKHKPGLIGMRMKVAQYHTFNYLHSWVLFLCISVLN